MNVIENGVRNDPPAPWGIALVMENNQLVGIVTDGDIRRAILRGVSLENPIGTIMTRDPLTVRHSEDPAEILAEFHRIIRERNMPESRFHHIITLDDAGRLADVITPFELWRRSEVKIKTVAVIGLGYVGLTLALTLCEFGIRVIGVDLNAEVIEKLKRGEPHFFEKGLTTLLKKHVNKNLLLSTKLNEHASDIFIVCVGTPVNDRGRSDKSYLISAITEVGKIMKPHDLVILRSTVPIGTCRNLVVPILERESGLSHETEFMLSFAPERTIEGKALEELKTLPQIIGGINKQSLDNTSKLFQVFAHTIVSVDSLEEAEAVKLLNNTFRDVSFSFANEVSQALDGFGISGSSVIRAANKGYTRNPIPLPSPGVGGACLVKDPHLFVESARSTGYNLQLPLLSRNINESMIDFVVEKIDKFVSEHCIDPGRAKIFLAGMAFKGNPETSDLRHSTSVDILNILRSSYPNIEVFDHVASRNDLMALGANVAESPEQGFRGASCVLILNNHLEYPEWDIFELASTMQNPGMIFDPWGHYGKEQFHGLPQIQYTGL
jgi:nucleotide sugar dehydrogenase